MSLVVADKISYSPVNGGGIEVTVPFRQRIVSEGMGAAMYEMFGRGEKGLWYDPSDFSTMFQDSAGTTAAAVEQPVGLILDKSNGLVLGPELVTNAADREFSSDTGYWTKTQATISGGVATVTSPDGSLSSISRLGITTAGIGYELSFDLVIRTSGCRVADSTGTAYATFTTSGRKTMKFVASGTGILSFVRSSGITDFDIDNVTIKVLAGNHATQATSTARPVLRARYNLLTYSEQFDNAAWTKGNVSVTANAATAPDGTLTMDKLVESATNTSHYIQYVHAVTVGVTYTYIIYAKASEKSEFQLMLPGAQFTGAPYGSFNLVNGTATNGGTGGSAAISNIGNGIYRCILTATCTSTSVSSSVYAAYQALATYLGDGTSGIYIWGAQLNTGSTALPYQRIAAATNYDTVGFKPYLDFDGVDDFLVTPAIDFTANGKLSVFAGVTANNASGPPGIVGLGLSYSSLPGNWTLQPLFRAILRYGASLNAIPEDAITATYPTTRVVSLNGEHGVSDWVVRVDGVAGVSVTSTAQNMSNGPIYLGVSGTSYLNGRIYSLIVRGALSDAVEINDSERYVNNKTGAYQ